MKARLFFITIVFIFTIHAHSQITEQGGTFIAPPLVNDTAPYTHLQGLCTNHVDRFYWSFNSKLYVTDFYGNLLFEPKAVLHHHGNPAYNDGKLYFPVEIGGFAVSGGTEGWVYIYDATTLDFIERHRISETQNGCGGLACDGTKFVFFGGIPEDSVDNYLFEYDMDFQFVEKHTLQTGFTTLGIQTGTFYNNKWYFGSYGANLFTTDADFSNLQNYTFECSYGITAVGNDKFVIASELVKGGLTNESIVGYAVAQINQAGGLEIISDYPTTLGEYSTELRFRFSFENSLADSSANAYTLTPGPLASATYGIGHFGNALLLNGSSDYFDIPDSILNPGYMPFTVCAWVYNTQTSAERSGPTSAGFDEEQVLHQLTGSGRALLQHIVTPDGTNYSIGSWLGGSQSKANDNVFSTNQWQHIAVTSNPNTKKITFYVNGVNVGETLISSAFGSNNGGFRVGAHRTGSSAFWHGKLDELCLFVGELTAQQVNDVMNNDTLSTVDAEINQNPVIYVSPDGDDANTGTIDAPYKTFSCAVSQAVVGDVEIVLAPGTYSENSEAIIEPLASLSEGVNLTIRGESAQNTIIQSEAGDKRLLNAGSVNFMATSNNLIIKNLTFQNGYALNNYGGAIYFSQGDSSTTRSNLTLENVIFRNNISHYNTNTNAYGGALAFRGHELNISNCLFQNNKCTSSGTGTGMGGALYLLTTKFSEDATADAGLYVSITNTTFDANEAKSKGGAIMQYNNIKQTISQPINNSYINFFNCTFVDNKKAAIPASNTLDATATGSAVYFKLGTLSSYTKFAYTVVNCTFANNGGKTAGSVNPAINESKSVFQIAGKSPFLSAIFVNNIINTPLSANCGSALVANYTSTAKFSGNNNLIESVNSLIQDPAFTTQAAVNNNAIGAMSSLNLAALLTDNSSTTVFAVPYLELESGSVAIDAGVNTYGSPNIIPTCDVRGQAVFNSTKDLGAFEYFSIPTGGSTNSLKSKIVTFFPNPVKNELYIKGQDICQIRLFDLSGRELENLMPEMSNSNVIGGLQSGSYIVQVSTKTDIISKKIIKR